MKALIIAIAALLSGPIMALNGPLAKPKKERRVINIEGAIQAPGILSQANALYEMSAKSDKDIKIIINSPGGAVFGGLQFINAMEAAKARGVKIKCYVPGMAASLAFQILLHCSERYAMAYSLLLFHPVRIGYMGILTPQGASDITKSLRNVEGILVRKLLKELKMSKKLFVFHYLQETMHTAEGLNLLSPGFVTIVSDIPGMKSIWKVEKMRNTTKSNLNKLIYSVPCGTSTTCNSKTVTCPNKQTQDCGFKPTAPAKKPSKVKPKKKDKDKKPNDCRSCHNEPHKKSSGVEY